MHSGEKSNKCNQCDYVYFRASDLKKHLKMHSGEKSNKCNQCNYTSSQVSGMQFDKTFKYTQWRKVKQMFRDQDVGLLPPVTNIDQSRGHPSNIGHSGGRPSQHYAHPADRVIASGCSVPCCLSDTQLIQPPGGQLLPRNVQQVRFEFFSKQMAAKKVMLASSTQSGGQKRTSQPKN